MEVNERMIDKDVKPPSELVSPPSCQPCGSSGKNFEAEGYCKTCDEYLCGNCFTAHTIPSICRYHVLLDKAGMPIPTIKTDGATKQSQCTVICPEHSGKVMEFYCSTHNTVQCGVCYLKKHKSCDVKYIPELTEVDNYKDSTEYKATVTRLQTLKTDTRKLIDDVRESMTKTEDKVDSKIKDIEAFRDELIKNVTKQFNLLRKKATQRKKDNRLSKQKLIAEIESLQDKIKHSEHQIISLESGHIDLFAASKKAIEQAPEFDKALQKYQTKNWEADYTFKRNEDLERMLSSNCQLGTFDRSHQPRIKSLSPVANTTERFTANKRPTTSLANKISTLEANKRPRLVANMVQTSVENITLTSVANIAQTSVANMTQTTVANMALTSVTNIAQTSVANMTQTTVANMTLTSVANMTTTIDFTSVFLTKLAHTNMKMKEDKETPAIYGIVYLPPNRLLATDWYNNKIKVIDTASNSIISHLSLSSNPYDITLLPGNQIAAVTIPNEKMIQVISISGQLSRIRSIPVGGQCLGICSTNSSIIVSFNSPAMVQVMELTGKVLATINTDASGKHLFENPNCVSVAREDNGKMIFVSDVSTNAVTKLTMRGEIVSIYKRDTWNRLYGLEAVGKKQVLVCNCWGNTVDVVEEDTNKVVTLLQGTAFPRTLCYCPPQRRLYVATNLEGDPVWAFDVQEQKLIKSV